MKSENEKSLKADFVKHIGNLPEKYRLSGVEQGEDDVLATASIGSIRPLGSKPELRVVKQSSVVTLEIRQIAFLGSGNGMTNLCVNGLMQDVTDALCQDKELGRTDRALHGLMLNAFRGEKKTIWDLIAMIVLDLNNRTVSSRSVVDFRDGEVYADTLLGRDLDCVPEAFEDCFERLASHAALLADSIHFVRHVIGDEPLSMREVVSEVKKGIRRAAEDLDTDDNGDSNAVENKRDEESLESQDAEDTITI